MFSEGIFAFNLNISLRTFLRNNVWRKRLIKISRSSRAYLALMYAKDTLKSTFFIAKLTHGGILKTLNLATKLCKNKYGATRETLN